MVTYTSALTGAEIDRRLAYVSYLEQLNSQPIGIKWDSSSSSPTLARIDINGNTISPSASFFDNHKIWGGIRRCVRNRTTGAITYGSDNAGTGLTLDGTAGDVLVEIPTAKYKFSQSGNIYSFWIIPYTEEDTKFTVHPSALQRGGSARSKIYVGAYEAGLRDDAGTLKLKSVTGVQPWTGGEIKSLAFTSGGTTAFAVDETLTGATSGATGKVVDFHLTGGTWAGGDAAGTVYIKQYTGTFQAEVLNGSTAGNDCATASGAATALTLTLANAETYGNNLGTGFGVTNVWTRAYLQLLMYIEYGTFNLQTALGRGIVDEAYGTGYAGKATGADSIDSRLATNGTGIGNGTSGHTPICWRGIENYWGNVAEYGIGLNAKLSDYTYKVVKRNGTGALSTVLAEGTYETGIGTLATSATGFISGIQSDETGAVLFLPAANAGSSTTYLCDLFTRPEGASSIAIYGDCWSAGANAGPGCISTGNASNATWKTIGCRLEYIP